jgi:hypothetical protein
MMEADGGPGKVISKEVAGRFDGLHEDVTPVSVLGLEVGNRVKERRDRPETFFRMEDGKTPLSLKETVEFDQDGFHGVALVGAGLW